MPLSFVQYTANGSTDTFNIPFAYISKSHIQVRVNGVLDSTITFPTASTVKTSTMPPNGAIVEVKRVTPNTTRLVDFQDGSLLGEGDLDTSATQNFYVMQETTDALDNKLGIDSTNKYDAGNRVIKNVANGTQTNDAVNYGQTLSIVDNATAQANNAAASANSAANSATLASDWSQKTSGNVDGTNFSSKEYAQGTQASTGGAAKNWAQQTGAVVTGQATEYSSKEYAVGTTVPTGSAKNWASKTSGNVDGTNFSSKEYAQGTQASTGGSAKNWATQTGALVTGQATEYSAKEYAAGALGNSTGGSAKDWATKAEDSPVITSPSNKYSAIHWANKAAASAASINIPSMVGNGQKFIRAKADETGFEYLTSLQTKTAIREIAEVSDFSGPTPPSGWLLCYGQAVSRTTYTWLFSVIGTTYGAGDGSTTFNLPDYRGRTLIGKEDMGGSAAGRITSSSTGGANAITIGGSGGAQTHTLSTTEIPSHAHNIGRALESTDEQSGGTDRWHPGGSSDLYSSQVAGGGGAHSNTQPWITANKMIFAGV